MQANIKARPTTALRAIVAEDNHSSCESTARTLVDGGFEITTLALDGVEAIESVARHEPDVVVLSIILPKKSGFQACREIKANDLTRKTKVILLSDMNREADRFWGLSQGADAYLIKPFENRELVTIARALITRQPHPPHATTVRTADGFKSHVVNRPTDPVKST